MRIPPRSSWRLKRYGYLIWGFFLLVGVSMSLPLRAQSLRKMEQQAINRTRRTLVHGDTIQQFTTTLRHPTPKANRLYYWQGHDYVMRTVGAYNGRLLHGPYHLSDRTDHLLGQGSFARGLKTGIWRTWRLGGSLASTSRWHQGRQRGRTVLYDANSVAIATPKAVAPAGNSAGRPHWWQLAHWRAASAKAASTAPAAGNGALPAVPTAAGVPTKESAKPTRTKAARNKSGKNEATKGEAVKNKAGKDKAAKQGASNEARP